MEEQTAVEQTDQEPTQVSSEVDNAQEESLEDLLKDYDSQEEPETPVKQQEPAIDRNRLAAVEAYMQQQMQTQNRSAIDEAAKSVKQAAGEVGANIPDRLFRGALRDEAAENPAIEAAFNDRFNNPIKWEKIITQLGSKIAKDLTPKDSRATESWNAVEGAMHSASTSNQEETMPDFNKMSDAEFAKWKIENG